MKPWNRGEYLVHSTTSTKVRSPGPCYNTRSKDDHPYKQCKIAEKNLPDEEVNMAPYYDIPSAFGTPPRVSSRSSSRSQSRASSRLSARSSTSRKSAGQVEIMKANETFNKNYNHIQIKGKHEPVLNNLDSPGPKYHPKYDQVLPKKPKPSIGNRNMTKYATESGEFTNLGSTFSGPRYTIQSRYDNDVIIV